MFTFPTDLPDEVFLSSEDLDAVAMRTVTVSSQEIDIMSGIQQIATFADEEQAKAEFDSIVSKLKVCENETSGAESGEILKTVEPFPVGDQRAGLVLDYSAFFDQQPGDDAVGTYVALFRRGSAITLLTNLGTEMSVGNGRALEVERAEKAWPLLCRYDATCDVG